MYIYIILYYISCIYILYIHIYHGFCWAILAAQNLTALAASGGPAVPPAQGGQSGSS